MVRLGVPVGGRVRKRRAVEDQSAPIPSAVGEVKGLQIVDSQGNLIVEEE